MKALHKDFWMEIRKSKARFISIFLIVALGVAFFSGIQAASPDMRFSGDAYYDEALLMDLKVVGTLGLTEDDVEALKKIEGVESAEGAYGTDVICGEGEDQKVLHVESLNKSVNQIKAKKGKIPEKKGEIFLDREYALARGYEVGDSIKLKQEEEGLLLEENYTVCGIGTSPLYISFNRGNTTLGSGEISGFAYVTPENFDQEVYTQIYLRFHGSEDLTSYTDAYDNLIEKVQSTVEGIEKERCEIRYNDVKEEAEDALKEAEKELKDGEKELKDGKKELKDGEKEFADAKKEVEDGEKELADAKKKIEDGKKELADGKKKISDGQEQLETAKNQAADGQSQLNAAKEKISAGWTEFYANQDKVDAGQEELFAAKEELAKGKETIAEGKKLLEEQKKNLEDKQKEIEAGKAAIPAAREELNTQKQMCEDGLKAVEAGEAELSKGEAALFGLKEQLSGLTSQYDSLHTELENVQAQLSTVRRRYEEAVNSGTAAEEELNALLNQISVLEEKEGSLSVQAETLRSQVETLKATVTETEQTITAQKQTFAQKRAELEGALSEISSGLISLEEKEQQLMQAENQIQAGQKEIEKGFAELKKQEEKLPAAEEEISKNEKLLEESQKQLDAAGKTLSEGQSELDAQAEKLAAAWSQISESEKTLSEGQAEIAANEKKISDGEKEIEENEKKLSDGKKEIKENEKKLEDARKEIEDGEKELADGKKEYEDAKKEIEELEEPEWLITDRNDLPEYSDYGDNADRIRNIGQVFPVIFFLVAALISLTTMTRMVEDQRTQIGTLKALGYSKFAIMSKYINYALLATVGGSICGVLIGEKVLPYIIISAYGIMYHNMASNLQIHYEFTYAVTASVAAVVCTLGATLFSCYRELSETPASLMRPPAPKEGKRVLLERITFFWKHLSFSWKSTLRNLFRYKKRLFMTIFGIAGSMALMLVGFGIQDSIMDIALRQYSKLQHYDGTIISDEDAGKKEREKLEKFLQEDERISRYTDVQFTKMETPAGKSNLSVYVYVPENLENFKEDVTLQNRRTKEQYELSDAGAAISEKTAKLAGLSVGDMITLIQDNKHYQVKVDLITENYMGHYIYMTPKVYEEAFHKKPDFENIIFTVKDEAKENMEQVGNEILEFPAALSISYTSSLADQLDRMLSTLGTVIVVLIVSAGMLAFVVLYNLNNINITERQRELATLKVLGFYDQEVSQYVFRENVLLTIIGVIAGAAFGILLHRYVITTVEVDAVMFGRNIKPLSFLYSALFTCGFSVFVNMVMHFKLKKIDMVESLKSVE
ncbi:MAG: FtsX-like permease family protein [Clostridiales bacterium]|nr:FtsX-like permease family protein [Clostridiales bacterium]